MERPLALVVNKDPSVRELIQNAFEAHDIVAAGAANGADTMEVLRTRPVRWLVADPDTPGVDPQGLLRFALGLRPAPVVIAITDASEGERAAELVDRGAFDVLARPLDQSHLGLVVRRALRQRELLDETLRLREDLQRREGYHGIVGRSGPIERLRERLARLAASDASLWFHGEEGTGKELAARTLHRQSRRAQRPFVVVSCTAPEGGVWSQSSPPHSAEGSRLERLLAGAAGGALLLEGVASLAPDSQAELLATLDAPATRALDVRLLASSTGNARLLVEQGRLLDGLLKRLAAESIELPALRERVPDIALLANHFLSTICAINHLPPYQLAPDALELLQRYRWPDNVQGLRNALEQAVILSPDGTIRPRDLPDRLRELTTAPAAPGAGGTMTQRRFREAKREVVEAFERAYLSGLMERHGGNVTAASQRAGMLRSALQRLLRKYGLKSASFRRARKAPKVEDSTHPEP